MRHVYETKLDGQQLAAFAAVIELGSFESAAERLHVTPSALSQRIKALKQRVCQVLVVRQSPAGNSSRSAAAAVPQPTRSRSGAVPPDALALQYALRGAGCRTRTRAACLQDRCSGLLS